MFISSPASSQLTSSSVLRVRMQTTAGGPFSWESAINTYTHVALLRERRRRGAKEIKMETTGWFCCLLSSCKVKPFVTHLLDDDAISPVAMKSHTQCNNTTEWDISLSLRLCTLSIQTQDILLPLTNTRAFYFFPSVPFVRSRSNANANGRWTLGRVLAGSLMDRYIVHTHTQRVCLRSG